MTRAVVFDLDGTLLDTMNSTPIAYADTVRALGGPDLGPEEVVAAWHIGPTPVLLAHFLGRAVSPPDIEYFYRRVESATVVPFPGVVAMLDGLRRDGYRLGVFTSATRRATTHLLGAAELDGRFGTVVCGDEVERSKPAPDGLLVACRNLGVPATEAAYVGDAEVDLRCATAAGSRGVRAAWGAAVTANGDELVARWPEDVGPLVI